MRPSKIAALLILPSILIVGFVVQLAYAVNPAPSYEVRPRLIAGLAIPPCESSAYENSHVCTGAGGLSKLTVSIHASALTRTLEIFDATALPANGAVNSCGNHAPPCLLYCAEGYTLSTDPATEFKTLDWTTAPVQATTGLVIAFSTSASGCTNITVDTTSATWFTMGYNK